MLYVCKTILKIKKKIIEMENKRKSVYMILRIFALIIGIFFYIYGMNHSFIFIVIGVALMVPIIGKLFRIFDNKD